MAKREPEQRRVSPRRDLYAADVATLVSMGAVEPPPIPAVRPEPPRPDVPPAAANAAALSAALNDAGVAATPADREAMAELSQLDADTVAAITRWLMQKTPDTGRP